MRDAKTISLGLSATALFLCQISASRAADAPAAVLYEIAANDGYGLEECLTSVSDCGQLVADEWCDAHGHGKALKYGLPSQFKSAKFNPAADDEDYVVDCSK